jgi:hypothetical protein
MSIPSDRTRWGGVLLVLATGVAIWLTAPSQAADKAEAVAEKPAVRAAVKPKAPAAPDKLPASVKSKFPRYAKPEPKQGATAPDFELARLESYLKSVESKAAKKPAVEKVKLSSFQGKKPVCLLFSSYT